METSQENHLPPTNFENLPLNEQKPNTLQHLTKLKDLIEEISDIRVLMTISTVLLSKLVKDDPSNEIQELIGSGRRALEAQKRFKHKSPRIAETIQDTLLNIAEEIQENILEAIGYAYDEEIEIDSNSFFDLISNPEGHLTENSSVYTTESYEEIINQLPKNTLITIAYRLSTLNGQIPHPNEPTMPKQ